MRGENLVWWGLGQTGTWFSLPENLATALAFPEAFLCVCLIHKLISAAGWLSRTMCHAEWRPWQAEMLTAGGITYSVVSKAWKQKRPAQVCPTCLMGKWLLLSLYTGMEGKVRGGGGEGGINPTVCSIKGIFILPCGGGLSLEWKVRPYNIYQKVPHEAERKWGRAKFFRIRVRTRIHTKYLKWEGKLSLASEEGDYAKWGFQGPHFSQRISPGPQSVLQEQPPAGQHNKGFGMLMAL